MNTLLKKYRLLLALTAGFLVLALQCSGASSAFARGGAAGGVTHATGALMAMNDPCSAAHASCDSAGYAATSNTYSYYREASFTFTVPTITGVHGATVDYEAGLGGFEGPGGALVHVLVAVESSIDNNGNQQNHAWYAISNQGSWSLTGFPRSILAGDKILLDVHSNLHDVGDDKFFVTDQNMNNGQGATLEGTINGFQSDGRTGECMVSRIADVSVANFGTHLFTYCQISTNTDSRYIEDWPNTYYHLVDYSGNILVRVGTLGGGPNPGDFTVIWKQAS